MFVRSRFASTRDYGSRKHRPTADPTPHIRVTPRRSARAPPPVLKSEAEHPNTDVSPPGEDQRSSSLRAEDTSRVPAAQLHKACQPTRPVRRSPRNRASRTTGRSSSLAETTSAESPFIDNELCNWLPDGIVNRHVLATRWPAMRIRTIPPESSIARCLEKLAHSLPPYPVSPVRGNLGITDGYSKTPVFQGSNVEFHPASTGRVCDEQWQMSPFVRFPMPHASPSTSQ